MLYAIDAVDTLFFRNASPFDAELSQSASSMFPPLPSVYAGALCYAAGLGDANSAVISRRLKIGFSGLMINGRIMLPRPLDTVVLSSYKFEVMPLVPAPIGSYQLPFVLSGDRITGKETELKGGGYLDEVAITQYLKGELPDESCLQLADLINKERHVGIQINPDSGATQAGMWYSIEKVRPVSQNGGRCSLVVEAEGIDIRIPGVIKLGGESRAASIQRLGDKYNFEPVSSNKKYFKLYLATPAIFKHGWIPWWLDPVSKEGVFAYKKRRIRVRLISAAIGRYVAAGGFSFEKQKPKEMRYAVPAGSVYFFEIIEGEFQDAIKLFNQKCISDYREGYGFIYQNWDRMRYCDRGFGYSLIGDIGTNQGGIVNV
ncbi:hypothetical protein N0M98_02535 [Paenibacillus doosanensis]|uniref:type III-B CRISPR module-associated Cmr3 family protein n=1 Tax=Paenibacillus doosanensis TaxID=1229154 RepID=UPI0021802309|nr:type III-B CRISPR module-associated Cmr3 family protein [Paenibacillus doosanensis]MCS7459008.1 hypothetical protein [Paenibacillus doosanensis]